jgi:hypothetical protein
VPPLTRPLVALWLASFAALVVSVPHDVALRAAPSVRDPDARLRWYRKPPPPLPPPAGRIVRVDTVGALARAADSVASGTTILIAPGRYRLTRTLAIAKVSDVALRGETGTPEDVVIEGPGLHAGAGASPQDAIWTSKVSRLLLAGFTLTGFPRHCAILNAGTASPTIHAVHFVDCGEQAVKANPDAEGRGVPDGVVEYSRFAYTTTSRGSYTNAISAIGAAGWIVRHTFFANIRAPRGQLAGPALLFRGGARDTLVESNTFIDCQRGVSFGMDERTPRDHAGGIIRNNFFMRSAGQSGDAAISLWNAPAAAVVHNTILLNGTFQAAIDYRWGDEGDILIANNLLDAPIWQRRERSATVAGNVLDARAAWFVDAASGDLHLAAATGAPVIAGAALLTNVGADRDWDDDRRPARGADVGADQRGGVADLRSGNRRH